MKCGAKYPCITPLKYRPKNPRLYFSEIKPLGLIHIQSLVSSWAVGLYNLVLMAVIGESCFVLVSCVMRAWTRSVELTYIWLPALSAQSKNQSFSLVLFYRQIGPPGTLSSSSLIRLSDESSGSNVLSCEMFSCMQILADVEKRGFVCRTGSELHSPSV